MRKFLPGRFVNPGDKRIVDCEEKIENIQFTIHKFTTRKRLKPENVIIFPHFSEFGSEIIQSVYCLPFLLNTKYQGKYSIVMGWHGRGYLYKHLVDEFWEIKEEHQWLREYCRAFHHDSKNLKKVEKEAKKYGKLAPLSDYGTITLNKKIDICPDKRCNGEIIYSHKNQICLRCHKHYPMIGLYHQMENAKNYAVWTPKPSLNKLEYVNKYIKSPNMVGITARNRICYGRNLPIEFYEKLIILLEKLGYSPIWLGEKETTLRCPFPRIVDYSLTEDAKDLETTLALVSKLKFTIQFWTASTRLAGLVGTPYILFESPDQIWGQGQEGIRMSLLTRGNKKLVISHYHNVLSDHEKTMEVVKKAIEEMKNNNFEDLIGLVDNACLVSDLRNKNLKRINL